MRLVNDRYHVIDNVTGGENHRTYVASIFEEPESQLKLRVLDRYNHRELIDDFIENIVFYQSIEHESILRTFDFERIETVNLRPSKVEQYALITENNPWRTLAEISSEISSQAIAKAHVRIIEALDYLHFRGITYGALKPEHVLISLEGEVKLLDMGSVLVEMTLEEQSSGQGKSAGKTTYGERLDYLYLSNLLEKHLLPRITGDDWMAYEEVLNIIDSLRKEQLPEDISLQSILDTLNNMFNLEANIEQYGQRSRVYSQTASKHLIKHIKNCKNHYSTTKDSDKQKMVMITGNRGTGKFTILKEILRRKRLDGAKTLTVEIPERETSSTDEFRDFLFQVLYGLGIKHNYNSEDKKVYAEFTESSKIYNLNSPNSRLLLYNDFCREIIRISRSGSFYIGIGNIHRTGVEILGFIDYIMKKTADNRIHYIFSMDEEAVGDGSTSSMVRQLMEGSFRKITLDNMTLVETKGFITEALGSYCIQEGFCEAIYRESFGNPKHILSLLNHFIESGDLFINDKGMWDTSTYNYSKLNYPQTIRERLKIRKNTLKKDQIRILEVLSCFYYPAERHMLRIILGMDPEFYEEALDALEAGRIISSSNLQDRSLTFVEGEFRSYIYNSIAADHKRDLHKEIAGIIMETRDGNKLFSFESMVQHLGDSGQYELMTDLVQDRIGKETNSYNDNSISLLKLCYESLQGNNEAMEEKVLSQLIEALMTQLRYSESLIYINKYLDLTNRTKNLTHIVSAQLMKLEISIRTGELEEAEILKGICEELLGECGGHKLTIKYLRLIGIKSQIMDDIEGSHQYIQKALEISKINGLAELEGDLYNLQGINHYLQGEEKRALGSYHKSLASFIASDRPFDRVKPLNNIGNIYNEARGEPEKALDYYFNCLKISEENGLSSFQTTFLNNISEIHLSIGMYGESEEYVTKSIEMSQINGEKVNEFQGWIYKATLCLCRGDMVEATRIKRKLQDMNKDNTVREKEVIVHYLDFLSRYYYEFGGFEKSLHFTKKTMEMATDINKKIYKRAKARMVLILSVINGKIHEDSLWETIEEFRDNGSTYEKAVFLINMMHFSLRIDDLPNFKILESEYGTLPEIEIGTVFMDDYRLLKLISSKERSDLYQAIEILNSHKVDFLQSIPRYLYTVGMRFYEMKNQERAAEFLLRSLDGIEKKNDGILDDETDLRTQDNHEIVCIKSVLDTIFKELIGSRFKDFEDLGKRNSITGHYVDFLGKEAFDRIFNNSNPNEIPDSVEKLVGSFGPDQRMNIEKTLEFIKQESSAQMAGIRLYPQETEKGEILEIGDVLSTPVAEEHLNSGSRIFYSDRNGACRDSVNRILYDLGIRGFIGIPIIRPDRFFGKHDRRGSNAENRVLGYFYVQTDSRINRFTDATYALFDSLSKLLYLIIENMKLERKSNYDRLTGVMSREAIYEKLLSLMEYHCEGEGEFSVLMMDIDRFKLINDTYGHQTGDKILRRIGSILLENTRISDYCGRYGGEEFIVVLDNISQKNAVMVAENIRKKIEGDLEYPIDNLITLSIGISHYPDHGSDIDELIFKADQSLYYAKEVMGRNSVASWDIDMSSIEDMRDKMADRKIDLIGRDPDNLTYLVRLAVLKDQNLNLTNRIHEFILVMEDAIEADYIAVAFFDGSNKINLYDRTGPLDLDKSWLLESESLDYARKMNKSKWTIERKEISGQNVEGFSINDFKSTLAVPFFRNHHMSAILYGESNLIRKEFTEEDIVKSEVFGRVFSVNLV